jgi:hypothetical protein
MSFFADFLKKALGKDRHSAKKLFAECLKKHSAKYLTLGKDLFSGSVCSMVS